MKTKIRSISAFFCRILETRLQTRMLVLYITGGVLPMVLIGLYLIVGTNQILIEREEQSELVEVEMLGNGIREMLDSVDTVSQRFYSQGVETSLTGIPMMRSMVLEFEGDRNVSYLDKQYMLGENLLVAPIFNEEREAEYYLPGGEWTNYLTGEKALGGVWRKEHHNYCSIPLWVREGSIIPTAPYCERADDTFVDQMQ